jgi:hypothetical protein
MDLLRLMSAIIISASVRRLGGVITVVIDRFDLAN